MKILIQILSAIGSITAIIGAIFLLISFAKKMLYYPPNVIQEASEKIANNFYIAVTLITVSTICFLGRKQIIKFDFHNTIKRNKIINAEINGIFFSESDLNGVFSNFEGTEGRNRCDNFRGFINLENNETIPIEIIRHCYEKNRYIIISKKYYMDANIGDIRTSAFDYIQKENY